MAGWKSNRQLFAGRSPEPSDGPNRTDATVSFAARSVDYDWPGGAGFLHHAAHGVRALHARDWRKRNHGALQRHSRRTPEDPRLRLRRIILRSGGSNAIVTVNTR